MKDKRREKAETTEPFTFVRGSGNVFADLGLPDSPGLLVRSQLMRFIELEIRRRNLTQAAAAEKVGLSQGDISNITRGRVDRFSQERLMAVLRNLGTDIEIRVTPRGSDHLGTLTVRQPKRRRSTRGRAA
jgi:predicted XRE-type DNA-binding protein